MENGIILCARAEVRKDFRPVWNVLDRGKDYSLLTLQVEFAGGALRCGEYVTIRKVGDASQKVSDSALHFCFWLYKGIELSFKLVAVLN